MTYSSRHKFLVVVAAMVAALAVAGTADAEIVALRSGTGGAFGLFQNGQIDPVFQATLPGAPSFSGAVVVPGTGGNGNITVIDSVVDDTWLWGGSDRDSTGITAFGGNTWDEPREFFENNGATPSIPTNAVNPKLGLLKFDAAQANGLIGGTVNKAELRLFFDGGSGPGPDGFRDFGDQVGRITSRDWVAGNKDGQAPGVDDGAQGVSRAHPASTNDGSHQDINNVSRRTRGRWFDPDGAFDAGAGPNGEGLYRDFLPADFDSTADTVKTFDAEGVLVSCTIGPGGDSRGIVDGADLARWAENFGSPTPPAVGFQWKFPLGDTDVDGDVDGSDFLTWQRNNGKTGVSMLGASTASLDPVNCNQLDENGDGVSDGTGELRGWFSTESPGSTVTYQAPTWGDGNDYFNPDAVDYTTNPDFVLMTVDGVQMYAPRRQNIGGLNADFPVSPTDGVSPGDGDVATETNSIDASSIGDEDLDYSSLPTEFPEFGESGPNGGFDVWDVTALAQAWADEADNFGLYVRDNLRDFAMSETLHGLDFAPVLFIDFTPAPAGATGVPEPSSIVLLSFVGFVGFTARRKRRANKGVSDGLKFGQ